MIETQWDLEVNAARSCNYRCTDCSHGSPFAKTHFMHPDVLERDLDVMRGLLRVKLFHTLGGEPLTSPHVVDFIRLVAASGMSRQPGLLTNGSLLPRMKDNFWEMMASTKTELRISVYKDLPEDIVPYAAKKCDEYGIVFIPRVVNKFFPGFKKGDGSSYYGCIWNRCLVIDEGYFFLCPQSAFFPKQYMGLPQTIDGIPIKGLTEDRLREFLAQDKPLNACRICSGAKGEEHEWRQVKNEQDWNVASGLTFDPKSA